jgi:hypothetical protein
MNLFLHLANSWSENADYDARSMAGAIAAFVEAPNWAASRQVVKAHPELLSELAEAILSRGAEAADADSPLRQSLLDHLQLLWACRERGVDAAFARLTNESDRANDSTRVDPSALVATLNEFVFAPTPVISRRVLDRHPELLSDEAEFIMANAERVVHPDARPYIQSGHSLLRRCREIGVDAAYAELASA